MHMSLLMARGDYVADLEGFFSHFNYGWTGQLERVTSWQAALEGMQYPRPNIPRTTVHKAVAYVSGWTVVLDPELIMFAEDSRCTGLAQRIGAPVFGAVCEGTSNTYGFSFFNPERQRAYLATDREVQEDSGRPLEAEAGIDLPSLFEDGVLEITKRMGVDYFQLERHSSFVVVALDESHIGAASPSPQEASAAPVSTKPWWRFW